MAKKLNHRRSMAESTRRRNRIDTSISPILESSSPKQDNDDNNNRKLIPISVFFIILPAVFVLVYVIKFSPRHSTTTDPNTLSSVVKAEVNYEDILNEHSRVLENITDRRHFVNSVLAYITPWNSAGYDLAKRFNSKFTHLSPVWYDLKGQGTELVLEGRHNADAEWISEVRALGNALLLPRVVLEALPRDMLKKKKQRDKAIDLIVTECKEMDYDGIVLESWSRWVAHGVLYDPAMRKNALEFVRQLGENLHNVASESKTDGKKHLQLVYVIGPPHAEKLQEHDFGPNDLQSLSEAVDGFSLMTYDFSNPYNPGPNAPLQWIRASLDLLLGGLDKKLARKILVGLNFYGYDYVLAEGGGAQATTGRDYLAILMQQKPAIQWEKNSAEHYFIYSDGQQVQHAVFYPSLMSISIRLEEARRWGAGISIWEIGQGLDYFFDLL